MKYINKKALLYAIITLIAILLVVYGIVVNEIVSYIFIIVVAIFALVVVFYSLYVFFDECF
jgi:hypothetical protein